MTAWFMVLFALYIAYSVATNAVRKGEEEARVKTRVALLLQTPLFVLACVLGYQAGVFSRALVNPVWILSGVLLGHTVFALSSFRMHATWGEVIHYLLDVRPLGHFLAESPNFILRFFAVSIAEELIYRVVAQGVLIGWTGNVTAGIGLAAVCFCAAHWHFFRNEFWRSLEFLLFALLLGVLYHYTGSFILVVVVHSLRNIEIVYHEWLIRMEEGESEEAAFEALEAAYARRPLEQP